MKPPPLIRLAGASVSLQGKKVLSDIFWELNAGENWAVLGPNGSGKSTFLRLVRGDLWPDPPIEGRRIYCVDGAAPQLSPVGIREQIGLVSPELQERYLQQEWALNGLQVIQTGFFNTDYLHQKLDAAQKSLAQSIIGLLGVEHLLARNIQQLSTGELRKILIARALTGSPRLLIFDEACDGLDAPSRAHLLEVIGQVARSGTQVLHTTHRSDEAIPALTHKLILENGRVLRQGRTECIGSESGSEKASGPHRVGFGVPPLGGSGAMPPEGGTPNPDSRTRSENVARDVIGEPGSSQRHEAQSPKSAIRNPQSAMERRILVRIQRADVFLDRKKVLSDINWEMSAGQHWGIFGPNGAGKSTLLKLISGDLHPALGAKVQRFDLKPKNTVWELKQRIGYLSPELQANYRAELTGAEMIASGFFSSVGLIDKITRRQKKRINALTHFFRLGDLAAKSILAMSYGEFRKLLLIRALVQAPRILICDEPFDGLDAESRSEFAGVLECAAGNGTQLIVVTHHMRDLPPCVTHALFLEAGRIVGQGEKEVMWRHPAAQRLLGMSPS